METRIDWISFLNIVLPHCDRWGDLAITVPSENNNVIQGYPADFKSLRTLNIDYTSCEFEEDIHTIHDAWTFPNIEFVHIYGAIPRPGVFRSVTACSIRCPYLLAHGSESFLDMPRLVAFLNSFRALESLSLQLESILSISGVGLNELASLPLLTSFSISSSMCSTGQPELPYTQLLARVFDAFEMPNIEDLSISFEYSEFHSEPNLGHDQWLSLFFPQPRLSVKKLKISATSFCRGIVSFADIFTCFPSLQHLDISTPGLEFRERLPSIQEVSTTRLALRSLRLEECDGLQPIALRLLLNDIKERRGALREIMVTRGNSISVEEMKSMFPYVEKIECMD
ncbi:hypothetical protein DFH11DRAFT_1574582 [Phellopilus nigrolimitatus]|nr:hypothetical protein DFH11DRAFT_1574582 [Phellopilus nigrolimitatus]